MKPLLLIAALTTLSVPQIAEAGHGHGRGEGRGKGHAERGFYDEDPGPRGARAKPGKGPKHERFAPPQGRRQGYGRGQNMPPQLRGPRLEDYGRYRLRRPPPGYSYHRQGNRIYLLSDDTGMIFEVVPIGR